MRGNKHPDFKGWRLTKKGYIEVFKPENPQAQKSGYILEHRLMWIETHGKPIPTNYIIHHINGIKDDNRPNNLVAIRKDRHTTWTLLKIAQGRIRELEQLRLPLQYG